MFADTVKLTADSPVPCPWVKVTSCSEEEAVVLVAVTVPTNKLPMVEEEKLPKLEWKLVEEAWLKRELPEIVALVSDSPVPCPWVKERSGKVEVAVVEVAVTVPAVKRPIDDEPTTLSVRSWMVEVAAAANPPHVVLVKG